MSLIAPPARPLLGLAIALSLAGCAATAARSTAVETRLPPRSAGYLDKASVPASVDLVPAPPAAGSAGFALDEQVSREARALRGTPRFAQATRDADTSFPAAANHFSCAIDLDVDAQRTPALYRLLERSHHDTGAAVSGAKKQYQRQRPFMVNGEPTCTPADEHWLRRNGSYPSGHTSLGWAWALILAEAVPGRADAIIERGRNYGESRLVCNVHWQSDVLEGRFMGAATVAKLHGTVEFQRDLAAARGEIAAAHKAGAHSSRDCAAEETVLKIRPASAL